jgi:hypothetical protein
VVWTNIGIKANGKDILNVPRDLGGTRNLHNVPNDTQDVPRNVHLDDETT